VTVLLALGWASRRRASLLGLALATGVASTDPASADPTRDLEISNFRPAPEVEPEMIAVESTRVGEAGSWSVGVVLNHAVNPLRVESPEVMGTIDHPVRARTALEVLGSYALRGRFEVGVGIPLIRQTGDQPMFSGIAPPAGAALGDVAVHGKARLIEVRPLSLAASATFTLPTANDGEFAGSPGPTGQARAIAALSTRRFRMVANAGVRLRVTGQLADVHQGHELTYGVGGALRLLDPLAAVAEMCGGIGLSGGGSGGTSPLEALAGVRWRATREWSVVGGLGRGLLPGIGAPDVRAFLSIAYSAGAQSIEPIETPIGLRPGDRRDDDRDGIVNYRDLCRDAPEDRDRFEDEDGCPDVDADRDGVLDGADRCSNEREDRDGHSDTDGCPDPDNDGDGVADAVDACREAPEDLDGFEDADGCDEPDNDRDGILDLVDSCALEAETINGTTDDDGCPDAGRTAVRVRQDRLELLQPIRFKGWSARLSGSSERVLAQVGATLRARRDVARAVIAVHVHRRNENDEALSQERADAIVKWLLDWGVEPERLEARGMGSSRPKVKGGSAQARAANDRVEIRLTIDGKAGR
jgi:outer membrane protein OmpA-like peptidoglycan-associated protein